MKKLYEVPSMELICSVDTEVLSVSSLESKDYLGDDLDWGI